MMNENELVEWIDEKVLEIVEKVDQANDAYCVLCGSDSYPVDDECNPLDIDDSLDDAVGWYINHDEDCLISMLDNYRAIRMDEKDSY